MKPVVSSLVALAIASAPMGAVASQKEKSTHRGDAPCAKVETKIEKRKKLSRVKHASKKPALHHATNVDLSGGGHGEPRVERGVSVIPASFVAKQKPAEEAEVEKLPALPDPKERHAKKTEAKVEANASKKHHGDGEGQVFSELVSRIRERPRTVSTKSSKPCLKEAVEVIRGPEAAKLRLTTCDGTIAPLAIEQLSILVRPGSATRPTTPVAELARKKGPELARGIRRVHPLLVKRLQAVVDHFGKRAAPPKLAVISGYRPTSVGSMHSTGRAIDFRMEGIRNEEVVAFCKTLEDTGCGYYPNSSFVHMDVRNAGAGHVAWIDASGPGESPRYVSQWPTPAAPKADDQEIRRPADVLEHTSERHVDAAPELLDSEAAPEPVDEHPSECE